MVTRTLRIAVVLTIAVGVAAVAAAGLLAQTEKTDTRPTLLRVPDRGIQPQVAVDGKGVVHLIYFKGEPGSGDVFHVRAQDGATFGKPLRVNSHPSSAVATGNIRGAHLALGKNGRVHVAWNGSHKAMPMAPGDGHPMLYTRLNDDGTAFEPQRNVIQSAPGLDGGGSVAADRAGNVFVFWHAPDPGKKGEDQRRVWVASSSDEGKTFAAEKPALTEQTGACGCCGMRAFTDSKDNIFALYRGAKTFDQRDMYLLTSSDQAKSFTHADIHPWSINTCPMSSEAFAEGPNGAVLAAWDTKGQVYFTRVDVATGGKSVKPVGAPGKGTGRKHPALAVNNKGETLLVWTEGTGWNQGGRLAWQVYDRNGNTTPERGSADGVPVWSLVAAFARADGRFTIVY